MKKVIFTFKPKRYTLPYAVNAHEQVLEFLPVDIQQQIHQDLEYALSQGIISNFPETDTIIDSSGKTIWVDLETNSYRRIFECPNVDAFWEFFNQQFWVKMILEHFDANSSEASYSIEIVD